MYHKAITKGEREDRKQLRFQHLPQLKEYNSKTSPRVESIFDNYQGKRYRKAYWIYIPSKALDLKIIFILIVGVRSFSLYTSKGINPNKRYLAQVGSR